MEAPIPSDPPPEPLIDFEALPAIEPGSSIGAEWWVAQSHLRSKQREGFVSLVTVLSVLGVVVGVAILNMVLSVMTGFELDLRDKILGANAHIVVLNYTGSIPDWETANAEVEAVDGVAASAPFVYSELLVRSSWGHAGVIMKGMDPDRTGDVTSLRDDMKWSLDGLITEEGEKYAVFEDMKAPIAPPLSDPDGASQPGILIGKGLMEQLQVRPGDTIQLINPLGGSAGPMGMPVPQVRPVRVAGVFESGMYEYDSKWVYVSNQTAQSFLKLGDRVTGLEVSLVDIDEAPRISSAIEERLQYPHHVKHWMQMNKSLFAALKLEKIVMGLILAMIVVVAALLIVTTLTMLVITKGREIAILKAMGASSGSIRRIFMMEGALIGAVGTVLGTATGMVGCFILDRYEYQLETDVYYLDTLPVVIEPEVVLTVAVGAFLLCFLATLYPSSRAASVDPVEGLRYE